MPEVFPSGCFFWWLTFQPKVQNHDSWHGSPRTCQCHDNRHSSSKPFLRTSFLRHGLLRAMHTVCLVMLALLTNYRLQYSAGLWKSQQHGDCGSGNLRARASCIRAAAKVPDALPTANDHLGWLIWDECITILARGCSTATSGFCVHTKWHSWFCAVVCSECSNEAVILCYTVSPDIVSWYVNWDSL